MHPASVRVYLADDAHAASRAKVIRVTQSLVVVSGYRLVEPDEVEGSEGTGDPHAWDAAGRRFESANTLRIAATKSVADDGALKDHPR
jgi:hypothetical protein